jgi:alpha-tubulin suppressor-like RCC1 family protein
VLSARAFVLLVFVAVGCGSRSGLDGFELEAGDGGGSSTLGGAMARGGRTSTAGRPSGAAGKPTIGGAAGSVSAGGAGGSPSAGTAGSAVGGSLGGEPSAGAAGADGGNGGEPATPVAVDLALGAFHSCAGFDDGSLRCWGSGGYIGSGNLAIIGDDETPDSVDAVRIGGPVKQLTASWYHTCVLLQSGKLRCFGNGADGKLGYGNVQDIGDNEPPSSAGNVDVGGPVLQVSAGPYHTCAVLKTGRVRCWGKNDHFQLGRSASASVGDDESPASVAFVDVGGLAMQVAAGYAHTCALLDDGKVRCWGQNIGGALGYGNLDVIGDDESPASAGDVDVGGSVKQIVAGMLHTCALLDSGKVRCWGNGADGRLGYGSWQTIGDDETPAAAGDVDVGGKVKMLAAGDYATCALLDNGKVRCWGNGFNGELGHQNKQDVGDDETPASVGDIDVGGTVTRIDVGFLHVCALLEGGSVRCWGRGSTAALGYGNVNDIGDDETPASAGDLKLVR